MIAEQIGDAGEIAILSASANATNQNAWIELMKKELANHPNIKLVDTVYGNDKDQESFDKTAALLQSHPDLKGIISPTTVGIAAAARYLSTSKAKGKVALTGLGTPNQMREYVKDGTVKEFALWNPADLGYLAAYGAKAVIAVRSRATKVTSSQPASSASTPSAQTRRWCWATVQVQQGEHRPVRLLRSVSDCGAWSHPDRAPKPPFQPPTTFRARVAITMTTFESISDQLAYQAIELPSWAFGNSGTRFKVFGTPGTPRTIQEKSPTPPR